MSKPNSTLTQERLRELFSYDMETGFLTRLIRVSPNARVGQRAGTLNENGYRAVNVDKKLYLEHRIVWFYMMGEWPKDQIDHINGIKSDNRLCNLREATNQENHQNQRKSRTRNKSGLLGVISEKNRRYRSAITVKGEIIRLGNFDTAMEAQNAYLEAKKIYHPFAFAASVCEGIKIPAAKWQDEEREAA